MQISCDFLNKFIEFERERGKGFAQVLIGDPEILKLDEPTVGLDPKQIIEIRELIKRLSEEHTIIR